MATTTKARRQFQSLTAGVITSKQTADIASLVDGAGATQTFTVSGAALGDFVLIAPTISLQGITVNAYVQSANTVAMRVQNESGGTIDLASCSWNILVLNPSANLFY